jgi:ABC-2 type transport system ATP-binding protein
MEDSVRRSESKMNNKRPETEVVLNTRGISKSYGKLEALSDLSFEVNAGEIVGLLGPNGAGKTTAIRVLSTILPADRGRFTVMGIPDSRPEEIRAIIGVLPESNGFPMCMTGEEFLTYMGRLYGQSKKLAREKAVQRLRLFGLEKAGRARIATYSRGMRQRLAIARSLINDPKILFLDEPTLGFDPVGQREMLQVIRDAAEVNQVAVILSSHLLEVVEAICSRVLILNHSHVVAEGTVAEIKQQVSVPHTCRIRVSSEATQQALSALSAMQDVEAGLTADRKNELFVSIQGQSGEVDMNAILQHLIQAGVPIEAFSRDSMRLSDAFLSMIEEV